MVTAPEIFISSTSSDLGEFRHAAACELALEHRVIVTLQNYEETHPQTPIWDMVRRRIKEADAVVCLVGFYFGTPYPNSAATVSYTQKEFRLATALRLRYGKPLWVFTARESSALAAWKARNQTEAEAQSQFQHWQKCTSIEQQEFFHAFSNLEDLRAQVGRMNLKRVIESSQGHSPPDFAAAPLDPGDIPASPVTRILGPGGEGFGWAWLAAWTAKNDTGVFILPRSTASLMLNRRPQDFTLESSIPQGQTVRVPILDCGFLPGSPHLGYAYACPRTLATLYMDALIPEANQKNGLPAQGLSLPGGHGPLSPLLVKSDGDRLTLSLESRDGAPPPQVLGQPLLTSGGRVTGVIIHQNSRQLTAIRTDTRPARALLPT